MFHVGFIFYTIALMSGIILMGVVFFQYRLSGDKKIKAFLGFKLSYTLIIILALVALYVETNLAISFMLYFAAGILFLTIPLLFSFSSFLFLSRGSQLSRWELFLNLIFSFWTIICIIIFLFLHPEPFSFIAVGAVLVFFFGLVIFYNVLQAKKKTLNEKYQHELKWDVFISILTFILIIMEIVIIRPFTIDRGFIFTLAISYIVINIRDWQSYVPTTLHSVITELPQGFCEYYKITKSEKRVARALLKGMSNKEMAYNFGVAENTVKNQIYSVYRKTQVQSRVEFVNRVKNAQLGQLVHVDNE